MPVCRFEGERARRGLAISMVMAAALFALPSSWSGFDAFRWAIFYALWICIGLGHGLLDLTPLRWRVGVIALFCYGIIGFASWLLWMRYPLPSLLLLGLISCGHLTLPWAKLGARPNYRAEAMHGAGLLLVAVFARWPEVESFLAGKLGMNELSIGAPPWRWVLVGLGALAILNSYGEKISRQERFIRALVVAVLILWPIQVGFSLYFLFMHAGPDLLEADFQGSPFGRALLMIAGLAVIPITLLLIHHGSTFNRVSTAFVFIPLLSLAAPHIFLHYLKLRHPAFAG